MSLKRSISIVSGIAAIDSPFAPTPQIRLMGKRDKKSTTMSGVRTT
jgi:hypothetical protein